ncbi:Hypothetical predicted protein [Paramuricea clavata]|uniref:Uncharacterized protein n=1 Tax=Paramuricea clavata TaxID=317549 RepID=A0A6S7FU73_PARCT|nr:Hypothetical predicted protein [Paramuricea clavata]
MHWRQSWSRLRQRSVFVKTWMHYHFNLFRYNVQWYISVLRHGEKSQGAQIPFMITMKMRRSLSRLGFQEEDIRMLKPVEATKIIERSVNKQTWKKYVKTRKNPENV